MKLKTLILTAMIMSLTFCAYAQDELSSDEWYQDFSARRESALEEYRAQGLSQDEIREKMTSFRDEAQNYRQSSGFMGNGAGLKDGSGVGEMVQNRQRTENRIRTQSRANSSMSGFGSQSGSGLMRRGGNGGGRRGR